MQNIRINIPAMSQKTMSPVDEAEYVCVGGRISDVLYKIDETLPSLSLDNTVVDIPKEKVEESFNDKIDVDSLIGYPIMKNSRSYMITSVEERTDEMPPWKILSYITGFVAVTALLFTILSLFMTSLMLLITFCFSSTLVAMKFINLMMDKDGPQLKIGITEVWAKYHEDYKYIRENTPWDLPRFYSNVKEGLEEKDKTKLMEANRLVIIAENRWRRNYDHPEDQV